MEEGCRRSVVKSRWTKSRIAVVWKIDARATLSEPAICFDLSSSLLTIFIMNISIDNPSKMLHLFVFF